MTCECTAHVYGDALSVCRYAEDTDWRDVANWNCNDNVHPSRHGTYDGISMHPYETMFVKESWRVGEPFLSRYTNGAMSTALAGRARGAPSTSASTRTRSLKRGEIRSAHAIFSCRKIWCVQKAIDEGLLVPQHHFSKGAQERLPRNMPKLTMSATASCRPFPWLVAELRKHVQHPSPAHACW